MTGLEIATIGATAFTVGDAIMVASTLLGAVGGIQQAGAQRAAADNQARIAQYQATLANSQAQAMEQRAGQERAVAQREAGQQRRAGDLVSSRAQAIAAASGGGALDPSIIDIMAGIEGESDTRAGNALYTGEERARGLEYGATLERAGGAGAIYAGESARRAGISAADRSYMAVAGTLAGGAGRLYDRIETRKARGTLLETGSGGLSRYATETPFENFGYY